MHWNRVGRGTPIFRRSAAIISGAGLERLSIADYLAYDAASTGHNWRVPAGYGTLIAASLPPAVALRLATPVEAIDLAAAGVSIATRAGTIRARSAILTVSTAVLAGGSDQAAVQRSMTGAMPPPTCRSGGTRSCSWRSLATVPSNPRPM